jgi:hypothetical protein
VRETAQPQLYRTASPLQPAPRKVPRMHSQLTTIIAQEHTADLHRAAGRARLVQAAVDARRPEAGPRVPIGSLPAPHLTRTNLAAH